MFSCSGNVTEEESARLANALGMLYTPELETYLGLPTRVGRNKKVSFSNITSSVQKQLRTWRARTFSAGGREVLIKAVVQAIPTYTMNFFKLPKALIDELHGMIARFWWGARRTRRRYIGKIGSLLRTRKAKVVWVSRISGTSIEPSWGSKCGESFIPRDALWLESSKRSIFLTRGLPISIAKVISLFWERVFVGDWILCGWGLDGKWAPGI